MIEIKQKINEIQLEYLQLLEQVYEQDDSLSILPALDAIRLFWLKNRSAVYLFLETLKEREVFVYSGITSLDISNKEFYGFIACGKILIIDDQLHKYADTILLKNNFPSRDKILNQDSIMTKENISILKELKDFIFLLPVSLFYKNDKFYKLVDNIFLEFFDNKFKTVKDYLSNCKTSREIANFFRDDLKKRILLHDNDDFRISFEERINSIPKELHGFPNIEHTFLLSVVGYLIQILEIIEATNKFNMIPIIRSDATLSYLYLISSSILQGTQYLNKIVLANSFYRVFVKNIDKCKDFSVEEIYEKFSQKNLISNVYDELELDKKSIDKISFSERMEAINKELLQAITPKGADQ